MTATISAQSLIAKELHLCNREEKKEMEAAAGDLKEARGRRRALRDQKRSWQKVVNDVREGPETVSRPGQMELTTSELQTMIDEANALGIDAAPLIELRETALEAEHISLYFADNGDGTVDGRLWLHGEKFEKRREAVNKVQKERNEALDDKIANVGDEIDELSFRLQNLLNTSNEYSNLASGTVKKLFDAIGSIAQRI